MSVAEARGKRPRPSRLPEAISSVGHQLIGASTGFMEEARGDWWRLIAEADASSSAAIELSALSWVELPDLVSFCSALPRLPFDYISVHAPTKDIVGSDHDLAELLAELPEWVDAIVLHPDVLTHAPAFRELGGRILLENMDGRKTIGTTATDLAAYFALLPDAGFCFDVAHAASIDPTMTRAAELLDAFGDRLREVHISSLSELGKHVPLTKTDFERFSPVLRRCRRVPWIFEAPFVPW